MELRPLLPSETVQFVAGLVVTEDRDGQYTVGDPIAGEFVSMPAPGAFLVRQLLAGRTGQEVSSTFAEQFGEAPDLGTFVTQLAELGLIRAIGDEVQPPPPRRARGIRLLSRLEQRQCAWLLTAPVKVLAGAAWLLLPIMLMIHLPTAADALLYPSVLVLLLVFVPVAWLLLTCHELAHTVVARAHGCPAHTRFGNRLWNLVVETDLSSVYSLPPRKRYGPLLAGMTFDVIVLDLAIFTGTIHPQWAASRVIAYMLFSNLVYQCCVFMRTDVYFVLTSATGYTNLVGDARAELGRLFGQLRGRPSRPTGHGRRELWVIRCYLLCCVVALLVGAWTVIHLTIPASLGVILLGAAAISRGPGDSEFWAAAFVLAFFAFVYSTLSWTFVRNRRDARREAGHHAGRWRRSTTREA